MGLEGKVALVTGAGRGLGRAYALRLARAGADVVINDIRLDSAKEWNEELTAPTVMDEIRNLGRRSLGITADASKKSQVEAMVEQIVAEMGRLDILVNNAGGALTGTADSTPSVMSEENLRFILDINLMSTILCCQAAVRPMKEQGYGKIVNVSSQAGVKAGGNGTLAHYSVAKAGIAHFTRVLAAEVGPWGITVNCIAPGLILTSRAIGQLNRNNPVTRAAAEKNIPLRRMGLPEDVAKVVEFFASDLSDYVTGQVLPVCGGIVLSPS
ncbi:MAG: SDR family oxidoreductase [Chloroflexi bacterium]|nr:SDR family oxidoreductase [Chloroflexota bacterium]